MSVGVSQNKIILMHTAVELQHWHKIKSFFLNLRLALPSGPFFFFCFYVKSISLSFILDSTNDRDNMSKTNTCSSSQSRECGFRHSNGDAKSPNTANVHIIHSGAVPRKCCSQTITEWTTTLECINFSFLWLPKQCALFYKSFHYLEENLWSCV